MISLQLAIAAGVGGVGTPDDVSIHMAVLLIRQQSMY